MPSIRVEHVNSVYMRIVAEMGVKKEISEVYRFRPKGYQFNWKYKNKSWDGYIRMFTPSEPLLYKGLLSNLKEFCNDFGYKLDIGENVTPEGKITKKELVEFAKEIKFPFELYDYQLEYLENMITNDRSISEAPTSSGKSAMIYLASTYYLRTFGFKSLIIVPSTGLLTQMKGDFIEYGCDPRLIHTIQSGTEKNTKLPYVISTWQSAAKMPEEWFEQFGAVFGDEAHTFKATSLKYIMESLKDCDMRHGLTGTLNWEEDAIVDRLTITGLFGPSVRYTTVKDMQEAGRAAKTKIKCIVLDYSDEKKKAYLKEAKKLLAEKKKKAIYQHEVKFIIEDEARNRFIKKLIENTPGNNLILFERVENHGKVIFDMLDKPGREKIFISGDVSGEERERIRKMVDSDPLKRYDIVASAGTSATGTSIKRIDNLIRVFAGKAKGQLVQSIGRTLRVGAGSDDVTIFDIGDNLTKNGTNYSMNHLKERIHIYAQEGHPYKIINVKLED